MGGWGTGLVSGMGGWGLGRDGDWGGMGGWGPGRDGRMGTGTGWEDGGKGWVDGRMVNWDGNWDNKELTSRKP